MTHEEAVKRANEVREGIEKGVDALMAHFEGGIYGEDGNGNWIVGYGVSGVCKHRRHARSCRIRQR